MLTALHDDMSKKGAEQVLWIIVVIVLLLIVMVVMLSIFGKNIKPIAGLNTCIGQGGKCAQDIGGTCNAKYPVPAVYDDCKDKGNCCLAIGGA